LHDSIENTKRLHINIIFQVINDSKAKIMVDPDDDEDTDIKQ